ncbi:MAG: GFA family protein [Alphaproteobacteria bacterium]
MHIFQGACHCGSIKVQFKSAKIAGDLAVRACGCTFCRTHGARTMTDPEGSAVIEAQGQSLNRYQFGLKTADFIVCNQCGAYMGAFFDDDGQGYATLNVNTFAARTAFASDAQSADYDAEDAESRFARRRLRWTPASLIEIESTS